MFSLVAIVALSVLASVRQAGAVCASGQMGTSSNRIIQEEDTDLLRSSPSCRLGGGNRSSVTHVRMALTDTRMLLARLQLG